MSKFKVGDKVALNKNVASLPAGTVGIVARIRTDGGYSGTWPIEVEIGDHKGTPGKPDRWAFRPTELDIIKPEQTDGPMTSQDLADEVTAFITACNSRVLGVGKDQYDDGNGQKFERMSIPTLVEWAEEEVQDIAVYAVMLGIRLRRLRAAFDGTPTTDG